MIDFHCFTLKIIQEDVQDLKQRFSDALMVAKGEKSERETIEIVSTPPREHLHTQQETPISLGQPFPDCFAKAPDNDSEAASKGEGGCTIS